ncbi:hypothetical protein J5N97_014603 [Dioscorea zingiberensis]|uniref:Dof-type domain-containing protein n=1 Tax=Dioscorea zingiberensis TaxID=325984 RepID=A0A9D5HJT1_9LILI|nr:hypothetical protein J5N97_014603 [Dioscorea zingiberensis]
MTDPAMKLFGRTIPLPEGADGDAADKSSALKAAEAGEKDADKELMKLEIKDTASNAEEEPGQDSQHGSSDSFNGNGENHETSAQDDKVTEDVKNEQDQVGTDTKVLKKPDKILPCPRCNSMDTKFCYYNNYNVNQPRHFCKNCQRYWTAGGTMRNVPVGAGRRKNKHSGSHQHQHHLIMLSDGMTTNRLDAPDSNHSCSGPSAASIPMKVNATLLKFGPEAPLCESMSSVLNLGDHKRNSELSSVACGENVDEPSCESSMTVPNGAQKELPETAVNPMHNVMPGYCTGVNPMHHLQSYPGPPWVYPWNPGWNNVTAMAAGRGTNELANGTENGHPNPVPWNPPPMVVAPAFCAPAIPFPFVPPSFWGCMPAWHCGAWNVPWAGSNGGLSLPSSTSNSGCSGNGSPTLGKHSRDANFQCEEKAKKSLWVPKTLRIDDPDEAAKSSIWATLGIKPDEGGIFRSFQSKSESKGQESDAAQVLHANPAALSRSRTFQEST